MNSFPARMRECAESKLDRTPTPAILLSRLLSLFLLPSLLVLHCVALVVN